MKIKPECVHDAVACAEGLINWIEYGLTISGHTLPQLNEKPFYTDRRRLKGELEKFVKSNS